MLAGTVAGAMEREGFTPAAIDSIVSLHEVCYGLTNSRSVLGSMNDIGFQYRVDVALHGDAGRLRGIVGVDLNRNPLSAIGYRYAIEALHSELSIDLH